MKKIGIIVLGVVVLVGLGLYGWIKGTYNTLVMLDEGVDGARAQVENQYQRRADLIPNLVNTVEGAAKYEKSTLQAVVEARAKATSTVVDVDDAQSMAAFQKSQGELSSALSRLLVSVEAYPELKANERFSDLMVQLEGTENRIATERGRFNDTVREYNTKVRLFPTNILAGLLNFHPKSMFKADQGAENAPKVDFESLKNGS